MKSLIIILFIFSFSQQVISQGHRTIEFKDTIGSFWYDVDTLQGELVLTYLIKEIDTVELDKKVSYSLIYTINKPWWLERYEYFKNSNGKEVKKRNGSQYLFDTTGALINEAIYVRGKREKLWIAFEYYPDGTIKEKNTYKGKKQQGLFTQYYPNGKIRWIGECQNGKLWNITTYLDTNGNPLDFGDFKNGNGTVTYYYEDEVCEISKYKNGKEIK